MLIFKYLRLPFQFDANLLQEEVIQLLSRPWRKHYQKLHYEGEWSAIPLRSPGGNADDIFIAVREGMDYSDTEFLQDCPYLQSVLQVFKCPLKTVRLMKLNAGAVIKEHRDIDLSFEKGEIRLHIPIITHSEVEFFLEEERIPLHEGECWYLNFNLLHRVSNKSDIDRIHLVIDADVNDWVKDIFALEAIDKKEIEYNSTSNYDADTKKFMILRFREMNTETSNRLADKLEKELDT